MFVYHLKQKLTRLIETCTYWIAASGCEDCQGREIQAKAKNLDFVVWVLQIGVTPKQDRNQEQFLVNAAFAVWWTAIFG